MEHTKLFLEGRNDELLLTLRERMSAAAEVERFEHAAQLRDAIRTIETLQTRQQKMASPELGDRDVFGLKVGPAGAVVQIFQMRSGRVVERVELVTEFRDPQDGSPGLRERQAASWSVTCSRQRCSSSTPSESRRRKFIFPCHFLLPTPNCLKDGFPARPDAGSGSSFPSAARSADCSSSRAAMPQVAYQARFNENVAAQLRCARNAAERCSRCRPLPRRIECFDISTIQGSETVASMVVCEDGRMKRSEYRKFESEAAAIRSARGFDGSNATSRSRPDASAAARERRASRRAAALEVAPPHEQRLRRHA